MTGKRRHPSGDEPEMTFESPDTVYIPEEAGDDLPRRPGGLGAVAVGTAGFAASSAMDPGSTSAADDTPTPDRSTFDESLDVFDTLEPPTGPDSMPEPPPASSDVLDSVYGAETSAGGGFNLTESDPDLDLDFSPIDFTTLNPSPPDPPPIADVTTGAMSTTDSTSPTFEQPDLVQALDEPLDGLDVAEMDEDDGDEEDLGG